MVPDALESGATVQALQLFIWRVGAVASSCGTHVRRPRPLARVLTSGARKPHQQPLLLLLCARLVCTLAKVWLAPG